LACLDKVAYLNANRKAPRVNIFCAITNKKTLMTIKSVI
jgi:hypothetical protein